MFIYQSGADEYLSGVGGGVVRNVRIFTQVAGINNFILKNNSHCHGIGMSNHWRNWL